MDVYGGWILLADVIPTPNIPWTRIDVPNPTQIVIAGIALAIATFLVGSWWAKRTSGVKSDGAPLDETAEATVSSPAPQRRRKSPYVGASIVLALTLAATLAASFMHIQARKNYRSPGPPRAIVPPPAEMDSESEQP